jgi:hypothetical protein
MKKENKKEKVGEFKFKMNEQNDVIHVFIDNREKPVDSIHFMESNDQGLDTMVKGWIPQNCDVANMLCRLSSTSDEIKEFYNERFDEICDIVCPEELLKEPIKVSGYYLDSVDKKISTKGNAMYGDRFGIVHKHDQIIGVVAFCFATHILARVNQGWVPDWTDTVPKWCIQSTKGEIVVNRVFFTSAFLAFETEKKAKLFLDEYKRLTANLSNAGII